MAQGSTIVVAMPRQGRGSEKYVALLRGINLGARNKVSMAELRTLFAALGAEDVKTYVQSGNVVFRSSIGERSKLSDAIEKRIKRDLGLSVTVLLRTKSELSKVLTANPFGRREPTALHVTFLAGAPSRAAVRELEAKTFEPDEHRVVGNEVYLYCPNGYGRSKLSNAFFEKALDVAATTRNWRTVTNLAELARD